MPSFRCLVSGQTGRTEVKVISAHDETEAIRSFSGSQDYLLSIEALPESRAFTFPKRNSWKTVLEFTEMMELLLNSGLSLKDALDIASSIGDTAETGILARRLLESIRKGSSFARTVESASDIFPPIYRGMVKVGDRIGSVERIFPRLSGYLRDRKALRDKLSGALAYPALVLAVSIIGMIGLSLFVLPKMEAIFSGLGGDASTTIKDNIRLMKVVSFSIATLIVIVSTGCLVLSGVKKKSLPIAIMIDKALLSFPLIGRFIISWETLNFAFAMETLSSGGVPVESAMEEAASVVGNTAYKRALLEVKEAVIKGGSLATAFSTHTEFPPYMWQWISIGERSGTTEQAFSQIRRYFQAEVDHRSSKFMVLIEPMLIICIGVVILALVISIVIPLFSMYGTIL